MDRPTTLLHRIRWLLAFFIVALILSGLTAFPLERELDVLARVLQVDTDASPASYTGLRYWIATVREGVVRTNAQYPFMAYGTDWLAFAHLLIGLLFVGPFRDPVRNIWVTQFGMIACVGVLPLALICGPIRGIPFYWQMIDCSFGLFGLIPLWFVHKYTKELAQRVTASCRCAS